MVADAQPAQLDLAEAAGLPPGDVLARLGSGPAGLSSAEAVQRLPFTWAALRRQR